MTSGASAPGGDRRKSIHHRHLRTKVYASKTNEAVDTAPKVGYNTGMKKDDSNMFDSEMAEFLLPILDVIFMAGFDFGKANIMDSKSALQLFKLGLNDEKLREATFTALDEGKAHMAKLIAADAKKSAEMN